MLPWLFLLLHTKSFSLWVCTAHLEHWLQEQCQWIICPTLKIAPKFKILSIVVALDEWVLPLLRENPTHQEWEKKSALFVSARLRNRPLSEIKFRPILFGFFFVSVSEISTFFFFSCFFFFLFHPLMGRVEDTDISSFFAAAADVEADILQLLFHVDGHSSGSHLGTQQWDAICRRCLHLLDFSGSVTRRKYAAAWKVSGSQEDTVNLLLINLRCEHFFKDYMQSIPTCLLTFLVFQALSCD